MERDAPGQRVARLNGSPQRPVGWDEVETALAEEPTVIVADDLQWFAEDALDRLVEVLDRIPVLASRRPGGGYEPALDTLDHLTDLLTSVRPVERVGFWPLDAFAGGLASLRAASSLDTGRSTPTEVLEALHRHTAGSPGLAADCLAAGWDGTDDQPPAPVVDAVMSRVRRAGLGAVELAAAWAVLRSHDGAAAVARAQAMLPAEIDGDHAERSLRVGGLVDDNGDLISLVRLGVLADLPAGRRAALHDRAAATLARIEPVAAADHLLAGAGRLVDGAQILASAALTLSITEPHRAFGYIDRAGEIGLGGSECSLLRALVSFHAGSPDVLGHLESAVAGTGGSLGTRATLLGYGTDLRELRFADAAGRQMAGDLADSLHALAATLQGRPSAPSDDPARTPLAQVVATTTSGLCALAEGDSASAIALLSAAADDYDRLRPSAPLGFTPHFLGGASALLVGDLGAVEILTDQAIAHDSGGPGERLGHLLLRAYGRVVTGDYGEALALLREHTTDRATAGNDPVDDDDAPPRPLLSQRDRLLLAAIEAAIARRSGDTGRLRASWRRSEAALLRNSVSWLLADFFTELLAAGARLDDTHRVEAVLTGFGSQAGGLPGTGPGPVAAAWLGLQVAISGDDPAMVRDAAALVVDAAGAGPGDERSRVRAVTAGVWSDVIARRVDQNAVVTVAERLNAVGDSWEASRLLGRAALDEEDPKAARRMLELARISGNERVDETTGDGLAALGLSDREAEVALLVTEGRTHKEIGAQLFISPKTVEHHVAKIRQKLGAASRAELLAIVREASGTS